jgi:histone deacetylase complex regulatory component SIN3
MIDNIEIIKSLLNFENDGDFYMLYIFKRKKDQPEGERDNHQSVRTIKTYCIESVEYLDKRYDEIKQLCEIFKARAYIHIQKQNHKDVAMNMITEIVHRIQSGQINQQHVFDSVVGQMKTMEKRWVVDVDSSDLNHLTEVINYINEECPPFLNRSEIHTHTSSGVVITYERAPKWLMTIPTKNGFHIITEKFDVNEFKKRYPEIDVQKKNPTLLYLPNSLN